MLAEQQHISVYESIYKLFNNKEQRSLILCTYFLFLCNENIVRKACIVWFIFITLLCECTISNMLLTDFAFLRLFINKSVTSNCSEVCLTSAIYRYK